MCRAALIAVVLLSNGCLKKSALFCDETTPCTDPNLPFCDLEGEFPASEGIGRTCIPNPFDASSPDASVSDAAPPTVPVINFQPADLVLGQPDFMTDVELPPSATALPAPIAVDTDGTRLWVADSRRTLQWDVLPQINTQAANVALGQADLDSNELGTTANLTTGPQGVSGDGARVIVLDRARALIWEPVPAVSSANAIRVVGQSDFISDSPSSGQAGFGPGGDVCSDGARLAVSDNENHRVLIWNSIPTSNGVAADIVLGQPNFVQTQQLDPPTRSSLAFPRALACDSDLLVVADFLNYRVLIWSPWPTTNNQPANVVVGQADGTSRDPNAGGAVGAVGFGGPTEVEFARGSLFVGDDQSSRVLVFTPIPTSDGEAAVRVLGQTGFSAALNPDSLPTTATRFFPDDLAATDEFLLIADSRRHRVLRFSFLP